MWEIAHQKRPLIRSVADFGAGDARFSRYGRFHRYVGYEVDRKRLSVEALPKKATVRCADAFDVQARLVDLCIGNPPYVKSAELDRHWRERVCTKLERQLGRSISRQANLFAYFLFLGLLRTKSNGLIVQLVPYEWVTRPSTKPLRELIEDRGWSVDVYRLTSEVFDRVLTTASISVVDKSTTKSRWRYFELSEEFKVKPRPGPSGNRQQVLEYADRPIAGHCLRGLSPGSQELFVLTEHERVLYRLAADKDVYPCVTSLRDLPDSIDTLNRHDFLNHFVTKGTRCWLLRSDTEHPSRRVMDYLASISKDRWEKYTTCTSRHPWWRYKNHPSPPILLASGFRRRRPKVLINRIGAIACGSVYAVFLRNKNLVASVTQRLRAYEYESKVIGHSNGLKKLEVKQVNAVIREITSRSLL